MKYICQYCSKECHSKLSKSCHERFCKLNPDYQAHMDYHLETSVKARSKAGIAAIKKKAAEDPLNQIKEYHLVCSKCGKEYSIKIKERMYLKGFYPKTCSSACAHSRVRTEESKKKTSLSLKKFYGTEDRIKPEKRERKSKTSLIKSKNIGLHKINCKNCNKELYAEASAAEYCYDCADLLNKHHFQLFTKDGHKIISNKTKQKLSINAKRLMKEGKIKPWQSRDRINKSYPEQFFIKVLNNNNIEFQSEKYVDGYFLDFFIQTPKRLIDLEIDGKQHLERADHDKVRDQKLLEQGYSVYRIKWNEVSTDEGSNEMKQKIDSFLNFYKSSL